MMAKLVICFCICLVVFLGSIAGFCKGVDFADSKKSKVEMIGTVTHTYARKFRWSDCFCNKTVCFLFVWGCLMTE